MKKEQSALSIAIGIACVWLGTHFGPGVASGTQILIYWVKYGLWGAIVSVLSMGLLGYCIYCSAEFARIYKTYNYADWAREVWGFKWIVYLLDISVLIISVSSLGASLNAIGSLLNQEFGLNYWIGVVIVIVLTALLCAYGSKLVSIASTYMAYIILIVLAIVIILCASSGQLDLGRAVSESYAGEIDGIEPNLLKAIWSGVIYASMQGIVIASITSVSGQLPNRSTSKKAAIIGFGGNALLLVALSLFFLSATTVEGFNVMDMDTNPLPFYGLLTALGFTKMRFVYVVTVFVAVLSTAVGLCFNAVSRYSKLYRKQTEIAPKKDAVLVVVLLLVCTLASRFGIVALVSTGFTIAGYLNLPLLIFPAIFLARRKISKKHLADKHIDAPGIED